MNETIINFLKSLNINEEKVNSLDESRIKNNFDVNSILANFVIYKSQRKIANVSIANIVGYDYNCMDLGTNFFNNMSNFFDKDGDNYHRRSVSMLEIPQNQIMNQLKPSFEREPICLLEVDKGVFNIGSNGLHRFQVIKSHYLDELSKINSKDINSLKNLREKYSFPANISEIDYIKSYSSFILNLVNKNLRLENHLNSNYERTGKSCLINILNPNEKNILSNDQLLEVVQKNINKFLKTASKKEVKNFNETIKNASKFESFKNFYDFDLQKIQEGELEWN